MGLPPEHRFPARKYGLLRQMLALDPGFSIAPAVPAAEHEICLAHDGAYVRDFLRGELPAAAMRRIGFPWSPALVDRTLASVGGTLCAVRAALDGDGIAGSLAGGTHHAFHAEGSGFCVFNDIAVASAWLRANWPGRRIAVVDLDVHQGDGTAAMLRADPDVLTVSLHGKNNFPFRKQQSSIDVALPDGTGDDGYLQALADVLRRVEAFQPDFLFYQSGVDTLSGDALGKLALTMQGLAERDQMVLSLWQRGAYPLVITLGGGYAKPVERTAEAHAQTYRLARAACRNGRRPQR